MTGYTAGLSTTDPAPVNVFLSAALNPRFGVSIWNTLVDTPATPAAGLFPAVTPLPPLVAKPAYLTWVPPVG